jgi:hypothetical protein
MRATLMTWWSEAVAAVGRALVPSASAEEAYLAQAADAADLERRLQQLEFQCSERAKTRLKAMAWARA